MCNKELEFATTDELFEELRSRFDACVFVGVSDHTTTKIKTSYYYSGSIPTCLGLCDMTRRWLLAEEAKSKDEG